MRIRVLSIWALDLPNTLSAALLNVEYRCTLHPHVLKYHYHIRSLSHTIHTHTSTIHLNLPTYPPTRLAPLSRSAGAEARAR